MIRLNQYETTEALFDATAEICRMALVEQLLSGQTAMVVSGGTTPQPLFERLSTIPLQWSDVTIVPSDERWLEVCHHASNERLIREHLQNNQASIAKVQGLKLNYETPFMAQEKLNRLLSTHLHHYAIAVVGMGLDGHFASLFPNTAQVANALRLDQDDYCCALDATGCSVAGEYTQRMTLTLSALLKANRIILLITGEDKIDLVKQVLDNEPSSQELPVYQLLHQSQTAVDICCA